MKWPWSKPRLVEVVRERQVVRVGDTIHINWTITVSGNPADEHNYELLLTGKAEVIR